MPTTVPIPAEIVGDSATIRRRLEESHSELTSLARAASGRLVRTGELGPYFTDELVRVGQQDRHLLNEALRRHDGWRLARPVGLR